MKVITNSKQVALEVISAQNLFNHPFITEIKIEGIGSMKHGINNYDAKVTIDGVEIILFRDMNFENVKIKSIFTSNLKSIDFIIET